MSQVTPHSNGAAAGGAAVRDSQISVLSQSSSAEDLLANLQDFPHIPPPFATLDQTRLSSPSGQPEELAREDPPDQQLTPTKASVPLEMEDHDRSEDTGQGRDKVLVDTSRLLRTHPNLVMEHYDPDTNVHTFRIAYPARDPSEQQHFESQDSPATYVSTAPGAPASMVSSPSTMSYSSSSSSNSGPRDRRMVNASATSYYVDDAQRSPPPSASGSPRLAPATTPFIRRKVGNPPDRLPRLPPDDIKYASLPLPPSCGPPGEQMRRQNAYHGPEDEPVVPVQAVDRDRRQFPPISAGSRTARLMSADELGAYRDFLTRRAEDLSDDRSSPAPSPAPTRTSSERAYPAASQRIDDAASDFSWDAQSVASQSVRSVVRSPLATQMIARGGAHAAVQDDLVHALQATRARQGADVSVDADVAASVAEGDHLIRKGRSPQRMRHAPRSSTSRTADVLASPAMTAMSGLEDEDALRELLPDFLDLGMDADQRMSFAPAAANGRNLMWILDEERALTSVPEGSAAPVRSPASSRMSYETGSSSGWNGDYEYERADPILAPTPIPGSHPRKAHSTPEFAKPGPFLRPTLVKANSHGDPPPNFNGMDMDGVRHQYVRSPEDRLPPRSETSASPHSDVQRYQRRSPLERLQTDVSQIDPRDRHGHLPPAARLPPRTRDLPPRDAPEIVYDRDGRAFLVRRSEPSRDLPYDDVGGRRAVVERLEPLEPIEQPYDRPSSYDRPAYDGYYERPAVDRYAREGISYPSREYAARRDQSVQREWQQAPRNGMPLSREQMAYAYRDDERHIPAPRDPAAAYPSPPLRERAHIPSPTVSHDLQRPPLRGRAYSAADREYVMYDEREYMEYRNRPSHGSAVYEHELTSAVGRQVRQGDPAYYNGSTYTPSSGSGGPSPARSPAPVAPPREHASPVLRSNGGLSPHERAPPAQERMLPPQDRDAHQWRPQQQRSPALEDAIRRGDIAEAGTNGNGPARYAQEPSPLRHAQEPAPLRHAQNPGPLKPTDQTVSSPTSPPQATPRPQEGLFKGKDDSNLEVKTMSVVESVSSKSEESKDKPRPGTPSTRLAPPRAPSPELMYGFGASPMGFSMVSFKSAKPAKPKPKPKSKPAKSSAAGNLTAAGVSEPNIKGSSFSTTSSEEIKSPKKGLFGKKKKA